MRLSLGALIAGGVLVVACSGGGDGDDADPPDSSAISTTAPPSSTTTTSTSTTAAPSTTEPRPPTTEDPTQDLIAQIEADLNEGEQALLAAGADPSNQELRESLASFMSGRSLDRVTEFLDWLVEEGLLMRPSQDIDNVIRVRRVLSLEGSPPAEGVVELCRVDAAVVYEPVSGGGEIIVNDEVRIVRSESRVNRASDGWRLDGGIEIDDPEEAPCDVAP